MKQIAIAFLLVLLVFTPLWALGTKESQQQTLPIIVVSILPQQYAVDRIGSEHVQTITLVGPGQSPHSYEPTPKQMAQLSQADAWLVSQTDFEAALIDKVKAMYPHLRIVDGTEGVSFRTLTGDEALGHKAMELDRHSWLGKEPMKIMASHILELLIHIDAAHTSLYQANYDKFIGEIDALFATLDQELSPLRGTNVFVYHPSFGYLFDEFGITQEAVETGGKEPTAKSLSLLIEKARQQKPKALFVQAQFPASSAKAVAEAVGAEVLPLDPLAYDWLKNIELIGHTLKQSLLH